MQHVKPQFLTVTNGRGQPLRIAYIHAPVKYTEESGLVWFPGFNSTMSGTKATALADWAARANRSVLRFEYSGHGASGGELAQGTIGQWLGESLAVLRQVAKGPQILVGSSMGGWLVLLILRAIASQDPVAAGVPAVSGAVLIAPAWDMTEELMWKQFSDDARLAIETEGVYERPSRYDDGPYPISRELIEEGHAHLIGEARFKPPCPVRILHGINDADVPWRHANKLTRTLSGEDVMLTLIHDGDHRLSRSRDIDKMLFVIDDLYKSLAEKRHYV